MKYNLPGEPTPEINIVEDIGYNIAFGNTGEEYVFTERWDSLHYFKSLGAYCLKIFDNDDGLVEAWIKEDAAQAVIEHTGTEVREMENITQAEYEAWQKSKGE